MLTFKLCSKWDLERKTTVLSKKVLKNYFFYLSRHSGWTSQLDEQLEKIQDELEREGLVCQVGKRQELGGSCSKMVSEKHWLTVVSLCYCISICSSIASFYKIEYYKKLMCYQQSLAAPFLIRHFLFINERQPINLSL